MVKLLVIGCPEIAHSAGRLRDHFMYQHYFLVDSGGARGEGDSSLLLLVWHAHAREVDYQAPFDAEVQQEHAYAVVEGGRRDCEPMCRGFLQPHGGR